MPNYDHDAIYKAYVNRTVPDRNDNAEYDNRYTSRISAMEVAA